MLMHSIYRGFDIGVSISTPSHSLEVLIIEIIPVHYLDFRQSAGVDFEGCWNGSRFKRRGLRPTCGTGTNGLLFYVSILSSY